ncbi:hypothetical protein K439DRAFT_745411 [Ramaria rubella]|nr:hypothetical protein K439DRAFT_745411 [Ramaria rubella]
MYSSTAHRSQRPAPLVLSPLVSITHQEPKFPPAVLPEHREKEGRIIEHNEHTYFSAMPLSPRQGSQLLHASPFSPPPAGGEGRRPRGYSDSSPFSPLIPSKPHVEFARPLIRRQRGYSNASTFSECSTSSSQIQSQALRNYIASQHPPGPGGNPKLDNSALQGIWDIYRKEAGDFDSAMIESWNASIDNLILFAGLFSGIITTFLIESYKSLAPPRTIMNRPIEDNCKMFGCGPHATRINTMWFTSLGLSLVSALIAMLAKQWIAGYKVELLFSGSGCSEWFHEACRLRQFRYDGMKNYKMAQVISATPILLHAALLCFTIGLVDFLWTLNRIVAIPITCLSGFTLFLYIGSTMSAVISPRSPFKTALARLICNLRGGNAEQEKVKASGTKMDEDVVEWLISTSRNQEIYQEAMQALLELRKADIDLRDSRAA